jgi:hypothetical protein
VGAGLWVADWLRALPPPKSSFLTTLWDIEGEDLDADQVDRARADLRSKSSFESALDTMWCSYSFFQPPKNRSSERNRAGSQRQLPHDDADLANHL